MSTYLQSVAADSESSPLQWWNGEMFSKLKNCANKSLCVPVTSSPPERLFSTSGNIMTCHKPEMVDRLVFMSQNL